MVRDSRFSRRTVIQTGVLAGLGCTLGLPAFAQDATSLPLIRKKIPSSGEMLPAVGVGTNAYGVTDADEIAARKEVLRKLPDLGGTIVDTAPLYGLSETVIGNLLSELGNRNRIWLATKVMARNDDVEAGKAEMANSFKVLKTDKVELMQVHNLVGVDVLMPVLQEMKKEGKTKYIGITTSTEKQYPEMLAFMRKYPLDFIQVDYSINDRESAKEVLPLAQERGIAVLVNMPFGGRRGSVFSKLAGKQVPEWAKEFDAHTWAQFLLKYVISHPAVTAAIPGTTSLKHLEDNQLGGRGKLPDAKMRARMEEFWDSQIAT